jgi:hypothetical protein
MKVYPTGHNSRDTYGLPAYEVRGRNLYPTVHNPHFSYGLPPYDPRP